MQRGLSASVPRRLGQNRSRIRSSRLRQYAVEAAEPAQPNAASTTPQPKKKSKFFRKTLLYTTILTGTAYGAGTVAALNSEKAHEFFVQNVPLGETIVDYAELHGFVGGLPRPNPDPSMAATRTRRRYSTVKDKLHNAAVEQKEALVAKKDEVVEHIKAKRERVREVLHTTVEKGPPHEAIPANISRTSPLPLPPTSFSDGVEKLVTELEWALKGEPHPPVPVTVESVKKAEQPSSTTVPEKAATQAVPVAKADDTLPPPGKKWYDGPPLPLGFEPPPGFALRPPKKIPETKAGLLLVAPAVAEFTAADPSLAELAGVVDKLAEYLESNPKAAKNVNKILEAAKNDLADLGKRIDETRTQAKEKLETSLDQQAKAFAIKLLEADMSAQEKLDSQDEEWRRYFDQERLSLLHKYQEKLDNELMTQEEIINQRLKEEVIAQGIELQRRWIRDVQLHVEEERGGRLSKLEELATDLKRLERLTLDNASYLDENLRLHAVWSALRALTNATTESTSRKPFRSELLVLKNVASAAGTADEVVGAAIDSLIKSDAPDVGLEPLADLTAWFTTSIIPRVSAVSLVPDDGGGVLMFLASSLISGLRFRRSGLVEGSDTLSTLARAEYYLNEKDLDSATRELNQLQGPAKELLKDWLKAARQRLEVQQAIELIKSQSTLASLLIL